MEHRTTRREFLKRAAVGGAAMAGLPAVMGATGSAFAAARKTRLVVVRDPKMLVDDQAVERAIAQNLGKAMAALTGKKEGPTAWKSLFKADDVVGIKVNCLFGRSVSTRPEVVNAIIAGLKFAGVKESNIIVWDRSSKDLAKSGFTVNKNGPGVLYWADDGDWGEEVTNGSFHGRISKLFGRITVLINAPVVKHHSIPGISCALKNHYGSINNPGDLHANHADPYIADLNAIPQIKDKTRLIVADALRPQADGGPGRNPSAQWNYYSLLVGTDPLAVDAEALRIIEEGRKQQGMGDLSGRTKWLATAADRGVGTNDPAKVEVVRI